MNNSNISILAGQRYDHSLDQPENHSDSQKHTSIYIEGTSVPFSPFGRSDDDENAQASGRQEIVKILQDYADWMDRENLPQAVDSPLLWEVEGVGTKTALSLIEAGFKTIGQLADADIDELVSIPNVGRKSAEKWIQNAQFLVEPTEREKERQSYISTLRQSVENFRDCGDTLYRLECAESGCGGSQILPKRCKLRICNKCASARKIRLKEKYGDFLNWAIDNKLIRKDRISFMTLTMKNADCPKLGKIEIQNHFKRLRLEVYKGKIRGGWVGYESHPDGKGQHHVHLHALVDADYIPQDELSEHWNTLTNGSPVVWIERVNPKSFDFGKAAVNYMTDYMLKGLNLDYSQLAHTDDEYDSLRTIEEDWTHEDWEQFFLYDTTLDHDAKKREKQPVRWSVVDIADYLVSLRGLKMIQPFGEFSARYTKPPGKTKEERAKNAVNFVRRPISFYAMYLEDDTVERTSYKLSCPSCQSDRYYLVQQCDGKQNRYESKRLRYERLLPDTTLSVCEPDCLDYDYKDDNGQWHFHEDTAYQIEKAFQEMHENRDISHDRIQHDAYVNVRGDE